MLTREYKPINITRNQEEVKYVTAVDSIDIDSISDAPTKAAIEKLLVMVKSLKATTKKSGKQGLTISGLFQV